MTLRSSGVEEENFRELRFYVKINTHQRKTQTFSSEGVHLTGWKRANKPELLFWGLVCFPEHTEGTFWQPALIEKLLLWSQAR